MAEKNGNGHSDGLDLVFRLDGGKIVQFDSEGERTELDPGSWPLWSPMALVRAAKVPRAFHVEGNDYAAGDWVVFGDEPMALMGMADEVFSEIFEAKLRHELGDRTFAELVDAASEHLAGLIAKVTTAGALRELALARDALEDARIRFTRGLAKHVERFSEGDLERLIAEEGVPGGIEEGAGV